MRNQCYGCEERVVGCHSFCDKYKKFREKLADIRKRQKDDKERRVINSSWSYTKRRKRK